MGETQPRFEFLPYPRVVLVGCAISPTIIVATDRLDLGRNLEKACQVTDSANIKKKC
jgi:hypothetical protein